MSGAHDFGNLCERLAADHLMREGWRIVERNYRFGHREIDLIARQGNVVAFVEVKGRRGPEYGHPLEAITHRKRREIERVARHWIARCGQAGVTYRFDAVAVLIGDHGQLRVEHEPDAWRL
jgi:putative endonuclease